MYYQSYEDYIRSILGYPTQNSVVNSNNTYKYLGEEYEYTANTMPKYSNDVLDLYPEIYKIVNPMVCKICEANTKPITKELVEQMTDEIYLNIEGNTNLEEDTINVRVTVPSEKESSQRSTNSNSSSKSNAVQTQSKQNRTSSVENNLTQSRTQETKLKQNDRQENKSSKRKQQENENLVPQNRQIRRNTTLRDLIKILILNQLLGSNRPQHRPPRPRPPYPRGPVQGLQTPRPLMNGLM